MLRVQCTIVIWKFGSSVYVFASRSCAFSLPFFLHRICVRLFISMNILCVCAHIMCFTAQRYETVIVTANRIEQTQNYTWHAKRE